MARSDEEIREAAELFDREAIRQLGQLPYLAAAAAAGALRWAAGETHPMSDHFTSLMTGLRQDEEAPGG